ncbi:zinc finger HIT domain-containing protein 3 isoform X1 [Girardinichthys multiradiatus]|uniref:zinc finger HIT domain-containing protein 3 isoform X1 n=1 Tax=Girardinichthys multiradiatus TaxID=208333 RepID=UPI001FACF2FF|nr:zinc finger HIT domain-containing protein 3 isoform X1 [Girardinichthys multiradiatus]
MPAGTMQICSVCSEQTPKYRCPSCKIRYCSLGCYKKHKDTCLPIEKPASPNPESEDAAGSEGVQCLFSRLLCGQIEPSPADRPANHPAEPWSVDDLLHEDDIIDKVPLQRLQLLGQSAELRDLLCNPHLRRLLCSVDDAESKEAAIKAAMQEPLFVEFADQCLKVVENEGSA